MTEEPGSSQNRQQSRESIWIIGDSYVRRGEQRAMQTIGSNLGLDASVQWFGSGGLRWRNLLPFFHQSLPGRTLLDVLIIVCGSNDMGKITGLELVAAMKRYLQHLHQKFPGMVIILSSISSRRRWRAANPGRLNKSRKWVNSVMNTFMKDLGGSTVSHPYINFDIPGLFLHDGVHFTAMGNDIF
ncbi:uncharacterized protein [Trachinotus anak]|uniref:uncharacterized protein n=1 Tax=Trachinotus anak TaxID=443729 RepID=UPI0039F22DD9